jgi:hypothetical protein
MTKNRLLRFKSICGTGLLLVLGDVQLGCSAGAVSGSCDFRAGTTVSGISQDCYQYEGVDEDADELRSACEQQDHPNGKWTDGGKCSGQVVATCRYTQAGGTITEYYYTGSLEGMLAVSAGLCTSVAYHGTWCNGSSCP